MTRKMPCKHREISLIRDVEIRITSRPNAFHHSLGGGGGLSRLHLKTLKTKIKEYRPSFDVSASLVWYVGDNRHLHSEKRHVIYETNNFITANFEGKSGRDILWV